jgi:tRNA (uracil-5-)-methyltransferase TRM9
MHTLITAQRLLESVSPMYGRILIYVWAIEQDDLSKRTIPVSEAEGSSLEPRRHGQDVFVPWVLNTSQTPPLNSRRPRRRQPGEEEASQDNEKRSLPAKQTLNRYYHMFGKGELQSLAEDAAKEIGLQVGKREDAAARTCGVEVVQSGWERSNYYVELRRWQL